MMSEKSKPYIYFIHGAWHGPEAFGLVIDRLRSLGYDASCTQQPTTGTGPDTAKQTIYEDAALIRSELESLINPVEEGGQGRDVLVVTHSYGGAVGCEACAGLGKREREAAGVKNSGGIVGFLYVAAFLLPIGQSLEDAFGGVLAPFIFEDKETGLLYPRFLPPYPSSTKDEKAPNTLFYHDLPQDQAEHHASLLNPQSAITQRTATTKAAYLNIPVTYLFCDNDQALPLHLQQDMVSKTNKLLEEHHKASGDVGSKVTKIKEIHFDTSHSPFLSKVDEFVKTVLGCIPASS